MTEPWYKQIGGLYTPQKTGRVVVINGPSSSGKTTIAGELQQRLFSERGEIFLRHALDDFALQHLPSTLFQTDDGLTKVTPSLVYAFHRAVQAIAKSGHDVIVDHVLQEKWWAEDLVDCLAGLPVVIIGVTAPVNVLNDREIQRQDRTPGLAAFQRSKVNEWLPSDILLDTSVHDSQTCVRLIIDKVIGLR